MVLVDKFINEYKQKIIILKDVERMRIMKYCCAEHVELALDEAVDEFEVAPQLTKLEAVDKSEFTCGYCGQPAVYIVANE